MGVETPQLRLLAPRFLPNLRLLNLSLLTAWVLAFLYFQTVSYYDPSSFFFRREAAYRPMYSAIREQEADAYIASLEEGSNPKLLQTTTTATRSAPFCLGMPTMARKETEFFSRAIGSLVDHLEPEERALLHIVVLLSDDDPTANSAFGQPWLHAMADTILVRGGGGGGGGNVTLPSGQYRVLEALPPDTKRLEHIRRDHAALVQACRALDAEYLVFVEDDVVASRDWFARLVAALPRVDARSLRDPGSGPSPALSGDWLYIRLFYSETYLGWNTEEWPSYLRYIALVYVAVGGALAALSVLLLSEHRHTARLFIAHVLIVWLPLFIMLYFLAGRLTVQPLGRGVGEMANHGCCSQGLVLPRRHLSLVEDALRGDRYVLPSDSTIEALADDLGLRKWALVPCVLQHAGVRGSSDTRATRKTTWNFTFERVYLK